ncbi:MAG TPA: hypothetical protein VK207_01415, partial [Bacteroidales bacterium]|nr:hypothetical protein [Bacteroidales bacterium]
MKQKIYLIGLVSLAIILTGTVFKINHLPGAGILLTIGFVLLVLIFLPLSLINSYRNSENGSKLLYILSGIACFIVFTAMLFKIMGWPFAGIGLMAAIFFLNVVYLPVFVVFTGRNGRLSINNTVFVLLLLALNSVFSALLSLNVSKTTISDSLSVPLSINALKTSLLQMPSSEAQSPVIQKIDETLLIIDEYHTAILSGQGLTEEKWNNDPYSLFRADSRDAVRSAFPGNSDMADGMKLRKALENLIKTAMSTPGYEDLAKAVPYFAGISDAENEGIQVNFTVDYLTWALVYL